MLKLEVYNLETICTIEYSEVCHFSHLTPSVATRHVRLSVMLFHPSPELPNKFNNLITFIASGETSVEKQLAEWHNG